MRLQQPFAIQKENQKIKNCSVILVDDIYTTGRTLFHALLLSMTVILKV